MKYLIVKCKELEDQYECDCDRKPICITDDPQKYSSGYDIYEVKEDGTLSLVKSYDEYNENGMTLLYQKEDEDEPITLQKWEGLERDDVTFEIIKQCGFRKNTEKKIKSQICSMGSYQENRTEGIYLLTEYFSYNFNLGK